MNIGVTLFLGSGSERTVESIVERARQIEALGFHSLWMTHAFTMDALTVLGVLGRETRRIELGTAVVPTFPRHPVTMAQQALTVQAISGGRFTLGIGLSHKVLMEGSLGIPYTRVARHMKEYLAVLAPLLRGEKASSRGEIYRVEAGLAIEGAKPVPLLVAALGPAMLRLAGTYADGTITSLVGPHTLERHIVPAIRAAAEAAGRPAPRIVAGNAIALTPNPEEARENVSRRAARYNTLPSYQAMLEREGVEGPADVAILGDEHALSRALNRLESIGVTDFTAQLFDAGPGTVEQTLELLAGRL